MILVVAEVKDGSARKIALEMLAEAKRAGASYADVRINRYRNQFIFTRDRRVQNIVNTEDYGFGLRLFGDKLIARVTRYKTISVNARNGTGTTTSASNSSNRAAAPGTATARATFAGAFASVWVTNFRLAPVEEVAFPMHCACFDELFACRHLARLRRLEFGHQATHIPRERPENAYRFFDAPAARALASCPFLERLEDLSVSGGELAGQGTALLASAPVLGRLKSLPLTYVGAILLGLSVTFAVNFLELAGRFSEFDEFLGEGGDARVAVDGAELRPAEQERRHGGERQQQRCAQQAPARLDCEHRFPSPAWWHARP